MRKREGSGRPPPLHCAGIKKSRRLCPDSWCKYQRAVAKNEKPPPHKDSLPDFVSEALEPMFRRLSVKALLERRSDGITQNSSESLHSIQAPSQSNVLEMLNIINGILFVQISAKQQCVSDRHPRASQLTTAPQLKASADGIAVACSAPDHEAAAPAVPASGLIVDLVTVMCRLSVSMWGEAPRAFTNATGGPYQMLDLGSCTVGEEDTSELDIGLLPALGDVPFEEYIATDSLVETCGALSNAEIVEMVRPGEPSHETEVDDADAASEPLPQAADVAAGLALAQWFLTAESNAKEALGHIYSLQDLLSAARFSKQKQTAITDFFLINCFEINVFFIHCGPQDIENFKAELERRQQLALAEKSTAASANEAATTKEPSDSCCNGGAVAQSSSAVTNGSPVDTATTETSSPANAAAAEEPSR
ncbi:hypothetical protein HPB51_025826 [Rhipicephalus microplus]|uniref:Uncharacterized protein n=1 Tax=Rhipicephalus microplus TaxID=6941 RepID=A0A9J6F8T4_RHIMP|nr:hypothetical protein HPB51_025826 [Rhipicephalus microplus]